MYGAHQIYTAKKGAADQRRQAIEEAQNPLMPAFLQEFMVEKQREARSTHIDLYNQLDVLHQIADDDKQLKHTIHDVQEIHQVIIGGYKDHDELLKHRQAGLEMDQSQGMLQAHRVQQNILNLQYQIDKVKGCLEEAQKLKEMKKEVDVL